MQCPQVSKDAVVIKNVLKIRSLVPETRGPELQFGSRATLAQQENSLWWEINRTLTFKSLCFSHCFPTILCTQRSLFCLLHAFSSSSISSVVSPSTKFAQPSSITPRIRLCAFEKPGLPSFPGSSFQLLLTPQVTLLEQRCFDTAPLAAIRIKSAPGCL